MTNDSLATVRTAIPILVGSIVTQVLKWLGVELDAAGVELITSAAIAIIYWSIAYVAQANDIKFLKHLLPGNNPDYHKS